MGTVRFSTITIGYEDQPPRGRDVSEAPLSEVPLVLVHGHPFDRSMWQPQFAHVAASRRVIAPDLRGYGETTVVPGTTTLDTFARDLADLLDRRGVDDIVLGGLSMGGQIVMEFYRLFPDRVRGLLLADTSPRAETPAGRLTRLEMADRLLREGMAGYADEALFGMLAPANVTAHAEPADDRGSGSDNGGLPSGGLSTVAQHVLRMMRDTPAEGAAAALRGRADRRDYVELLPRITVPTLVVVGSEDGFTPVDEARFMHGLIPGATLAIIEGAGHLPNLERPTAFNSALDHLLRSADPDATMDRC